MDKILEELNELVEGKLEEMGIKKELTSGDKILSNIEDIEKNKKGAYTYIYISDNGMSVEGTTPDVMTILSLLVLKLRDNGMEENLIRKSIEIGLANSKEKMDMLKDTIKKYSEMLEEK